ncbi:unnamed protein product, partial [Symbiodinium pilosum]
VANNRRKQKVEQHMCGLMRSNEDNQQGYFLLRWETAVLGEKLRQLDRLVISQKPGRDRALGRIRWYRSDGRSRKVILFRAWTQISADWRQKRKSKERYVMAGLQEESLTIAFLLRAWQGAARSEIIDKRQAEIQRIKAAHEEDLERLRESFVGKMRQEKEAQIEARQEDLRKHFAGSQEALRLSSFSSWRDYTVMSRQQRLLGGAAKQRAEVAAQRAAVGLLQSLLAAAMGAWADHCRQEKSLSRMPNMLLTEDIFHLPISA